MAGVELFDEAGDCCEGGVYGIPKDQGEGRLKLSERREHRVLWLGGSVRNPEREADW